MFEEHGTFENATVWDTGWYVARRIAVPCGSASHALGEVLRTGALPDRAPVVVDTVRHGRPGEARGFTGRLHLRGLHPSVPVEVELEPWSTTDAVLGLRPARRPPTRRADRYFESAIGVLADLESAVLARVMPAPSSFEVRRAS